jgi:hypothetical protein
MMRQMSNPGKIIGACIGIPVIIFLCWPLLLLLGAIILGIWIVGSIGSLLTGGTF